MKVPPGHQIKLLKALNKSEPRQIISSGITKRTDLIELPEGDNPLEEDNKKLMKVINNSEKAFIKENFIEKNIIKGSSVVHKGILPKNIPNEKSLTNVVEKTINTIERPYATSAQSKLRKKVSFKEITPLIPIVKTCCDEGIGTSPRTSPKSSSKLLPRLSCWNCFKLFEVLPFQAYSKSFCSGSCEGVFLSLNEQNCDKCGIKTLKQQGIFRNNSFFCNEKCAPKLEDLYKVWSLELKEEIIKEEAIIKKGDSTLIEEKLIIKEDFDLFQDLKGWGTKSSKTEGFLSMKELEEKYEKLNNSEK